MSTVSNSMQNAKGKFITLEGGEGVGKSSNMRFIQTYLEEQGIRCIVTREPGGTPLAEEIREVLLANRDERVAVNTELLLMFAARAQHLAEKILPALAQGIWVLSDRFTDATYAYQSGGREISNEKVATLESFVQEEFRPDLTVLLDAPIEVGMARASKRGELDRFENEHLEFFDRVRQKYLSRAASEPERFAVVDASQDLEQVQAQIAKVLSDIV